MISSGALPNVTFNRPPMPGPARWASSSVARPISAAVGTTPSAEEKNTMIGSASSWSRTIAMTMNGTSRYGQPCPLSRKERRSVFEALASLTAAEDTDRGRWEVGESLTGQQVGALARLGRVALCVLDARGVLVH